MNPLKELLQDQAIVSVPPTATVREAAKAMAGANVGCVAILEDRRLLGLFTERDILKRVLLKDLHTDEVHVREVMTVEVVTANPEMSSTEARRLLKQRHIRHLPVVESDGTLLGVLSIRDLIRDEIQDARQSVEELQRYIQGS